MIKWIMHTVMRRFERTYDYDASYLHEIIDVSTNAGIRSFGLPMLTQMVGPEIALWAGASLASTLDGDCGPCAQLTINSAVQSGVQPALLTACLKRDFEAAGAAGLGYRFAESTIAGSVESDALREEILSAFGKNALIAAAYATAACRAYPVLKRALGHGMACRQLQVDGQMHLVIRTDG